MRQKAQAEARLPAMTPIKPMRSNYNFPYALSYLKTFLLPNADVWALRTHTSFIVAGIQLARLANRFARSTNHRPEVFYIVPMEELWEILCRGI